ncbi:hypothetical protein ABI59_10555 [Acidobacteria bacterium Mor1]|nr:hypothetical protein ABI59_10555 [Acidobacteria bacterium Mor1]
MSGSSGSRRTTRGARAAGRAAMPRLFPAEELQLRPSSAGVLARLARLPGRSATPREQKVDEDKAAMDRLKEQGRELARKFKLGGYVLEPEQDGVTEHYGICYSDGTIRIRLRHATTGRLLKESSLVDTLCHELAHLKHFNHGPGFRRLYGKILDEARRQGYYQPGPGDTGPRQGSLFDGDGCGNHRAGAAPRRPTPER